MFGNFLLINLMLSVLKVKYSECNPDTLNEIKAYLEMYKEKSYRLHELKSQGYYDKNKTTGIRIFGAHKRSFTSLISRKSMIKQDNKIPKTPGKVKNFSNLLNLQGIMRLTKKTFGFANKEKIDAIFRKTRLLTLKEAAANLGNKTIEIRIDKCMHYEFESLNDVIPWRYCLYYQ